MIKTNSVLKSRFSVFNLRLILIIILISFFLFMFMPGALSGEVKAVDNGSTEEDDGFWNSDTMIAIALVFMGVIILLTEPFIPGLFIAIPGAVLATIGIFGLIRPDMLFSPISITLGLVVGIISVVIAVKLYRILSPNRPPTTTVGDSLIGKEGIVLTPTDPDKPTKGKVRIGSTPWSATADRVIPEGKKVVVIASEGVHVKVKMIDDDTRVRRRVKKAEDN